MAVIFFDAYRRVRDHRRSQFGYRLDDSPVSSKPTPLSALEKAFDDELPPEVKKTNSSKFSSFGRSSKESPDTSASEEEDDHYDLPQAVEPHQKAALHGKRQLTVRIQTKKSTQAQANKSKPLNEMKDVDERRETLQKQRSEQEDAIGSNYAAATRHKDESKDKHLYKPTIAASPGDGDFYASRRQSVAARKAQEKTRQQSAQSQLSQPEPANKNKQSTNKQAASHEAQSKETKESSVGQAPEEVIAMYVVAKSGETFVGEQLVHKLLSLEMRHGEMQIFHRYERPEQHDGVLFSMANIKKPGYFELDHMNSFETPGVTFFMSLPGPGRSLYAFDLMVDTARKLSIALDGELRDDQQSMITPQTVEHYRQRVMEFERKQRMNQKVRQYRDRAGLASENER